MARSTKEWIGRTADTPIPPRVKLRVFERHGGICHISRRKIAAGEPWECDHVVALVNWTGEGHGNRETNLAPALRDKHKEKTKADVALKSANYKKRLKNVGIKTKRHVIPGSRDSKFRKKIDGTVEFR